MPELSIYATVVSLFVQLLKALIKDRLPDEAYPVFAIFLGLGVALAVKATLLTGINIGLASMGIYAVAKHTALGLNRVFPN